MKQELSGNPKAMRSVSPGSEIVGSQVRLDNVEGLIEILRGTGPSWPCVQEPVIGAPRDQVKMDVLYKLARGSKVVLKNIHPRSLYRLVDSLGNLLHNDDARFELFLGNLQYGGVVFLCHYQGITGIDWIDIEKAKDMLILINGGARDLASGYSAKDAVWHKQPLCRFLDNRGFSTGTLQLKSRALTGDQPHLYL
jgi:hypothetical protein